MDYQSIENLNFLVNNDKDHNDLSIIKPVLIDKSANPFYLIDRKNLAAFKQLMLNVNDQTPGVDYAEFSQFYQPNQLNQPNQFNQQFNKSDLVSIPKIDKNIILSKSFLISDEESKSSKSTTNTLKKIGIKISRFLSLTKPELKTEEKSSLESNRSEEESVNEEKNDSIKDLIDVVGEEPNEEFNDNLAEESSYDTINVSNDKGGLINKFSSYKDLIKNRILMRIDSKEEDAETELNQVYKLAKFIEKNLRLIGLDQVEQLFAFNKTLTFKNLKNLNSLIGQINSKLEEDGDLFSMLSKIDKSNMDKIKRLDDDEGLSSLDLFREFEDYLKEKRKELRKRKRNMIKKFNDDHDYIISSINNKRNDLIKKSRKRRSRKINSRRKPLGRSRSKFNRSKFKKPNKQIRKLDRSGRPSRERSKLSYEKKSFKNCDNINDDECGEESEIHEQYVPFNQDDQQTSESYGSNLQQDNQNDQADDQYRKENNHNENYNDNQQDYNQQQNYNNDQQDYDQQQSNYRPQDLRLKSNVKYEDSPSEQYESSQQPDNHNSNSASYESQPETSYEHTNQMNEYEYSGGEDLSSSQMLDDNEELNYRLPHNHHYITNYYEHPLTTEHPLISLKRLKLKHLNKHLAPHSAGHHPEQGHHHLEPGLDPHYGPPHHGPPHHSHPEPHPKDDLTLTKELITNLLFQNKHKIFAILKATKLSHLLINKQIIAVALKVFFGKSVYTKKKLILAAYKKCYIKIRTIDMLLIPVGVGTLLTPLFLPLAPLALILFGIIKLYTCFLCFLLAI